MLPRRHVTATLATAALLLAAPVAFAPPAFAKDKPPILIAHPAPLSGILASTGKLQSIAVDLGIADVNAAGGINGSKLTVVRYDDQLKPDQGVLRIRDAMAANAFAILGPMSGTQWETATPLLNALKFPGINMNASKAGINRRPWALRMATPDDTGIPEGLADFLKHNPTVKKIVVIGDVREASGRAAVGEWTEEAKKHGLTLLGQVTFTSGQSDFSPIAIRLKEFNPDGILASILYPDAVRLAHEMEVQGVRVPLLANGLMWPGTLPQTLTKTIGADAHFWLPTGYATNEWSNGDQALYKKFVERYTAAVLKDPGMSQFKPVNVANSPTGYDAVILLADIMKREGIDGNTPVAEARQKIMEGMMETKEFRGTSDYKIRDTGDGYVPMHALEIDPKRGEWAMP